jgi:hypothetical protein
MKVKYNIKKDPARVTSEQGKAGAPDGASLNRGKMSGMEEGVFSDVVDKFKNKIKGGADPKDIKPSDAYSGISDYLGRLKRKFRAGTGSTAGAGTGSTAGAGTGSTAGTVSTAGQTGTGSTAGAGSATNNQPQPASQQPTPSAGQKTTKGINDGTENIVLPHANLIKNSLINNIGKSLSSTLQAFPPEQKKLIMTKIMGYISSLPQRANQVIAEALTPEQEKMKAVLKAKHATNPNILDRQLDILQKQLMDQIKKDITLDNIKDKLFYSIPKDKQNSKEALQYIKSLQKQPEKHLNAFLNNTNLVIKNIISMTRASIRKPNNPPPPPVSGLKEYKNLLEESNVKRFQILSGIKNEN